MLINQYYYLPPITNYQSPITSHQSTITNHQSPITSHKSPVTNLCVHSSANADHLSGYIGRKVAGKKKGNHGNIIRGSGTAERDGFCPAFTDILW